MKTPFDIKKAPWTAIWETTQACDIACLDYDDCIQPDPDPLELTTQEAADMLNISRPSLIQLLDEGKIEFRRVGTHRRVRFEALMEYKRQADAERRKVVKQLAAYDQELGI